MLLIIIFKYYLIQIQCSFSIKHAMTEASIDAEIQYLSYPVPVS